MERNRLMIILLLATVAFTGCCSRLKSAPPKVVNHAQVRRHPYLIAHIEHDGLHFSVSMDETETSFLNIHLSEKEDDKSSSLPTVNLKVLMTDNITIEGEAKKPLGWFANGSYEQLDYRFALGRHASVDDIHSITVLIDNQQYVFFPF